MKKEKCIKNWKHYLIVCFMAFFIFAFICYGDKECDCNPKTHLGINESCSCGTGCSCSEQTAVLADTSIPIRKQAGVTFAQMNGAVEMLNESYGILTGSQKNNFNIKFTEIRITSGSNVIHSETLLMVGYGASVDNILDYLMLNSLV